MSDDALGLVAALERFARARVWVVGDVMLDVWIRGDAARVSPEAPVPVVRVSERSASPGGAANVARAVAALGGAVVLAAVVGADAAAGELERLCAAAGVRALLIADAARPTTTKLRVVAHGQQLVRCDSEDDTPLSPATGAALWSALARAEPPDAIIISDYGKGVVGPDLCERLATLSRERGVPLLVDPKHADFARYRGATLIAPNAHELEQAAGTPVDLDDDAALGSIAARLAGVADAEGLVLTLGARGMAVWQPGAPLVRVAATAQRVYDVTGAGDTVMAALALGLVAGMPLVAAAELANRAAGLAVAEPGAAVIGADALVRAMPPPARTGTALEPAELARRLAWWRRCGARVVFTNGCFDLLHSGHVTLLERARALGDVLVVGLNSDASARALKGAPRPFVAAEDRARVLVALAAVDAVVVFDAPTPLELVRLVRPDVLVKGGDYRLDQVVGRAEVESWGGRVELIPLVEGRSSTGLVAAVRTSGGQGARGGGGAGA